MQRQLPALSVCLHIAWMIFPGMHGHHYFQLIESQQNGSYFTECVKSIFWNEDGWNKIKIPSNGSRVQMLGNELATNHYLNQWWRSCMASELSRLPPVTCDMNAIVLILWISSQSQKTNSARECQLLVHDWWELYRVVDFQLYLMYDLSFALFQLVLKRFWPIIAATNGSD